MPRTTLKPPRATGRVTRLGLAAVVVAALIVSVGADPAGAADSYAQPRADTGSSAAARTTEVTLITGDRVLLAPAGPGGPPYELQPAPRSDGSGPAFATTRDGDDLYVIPNDVADLVPLVLDRELFNVTGIVAMGYDDRMRRSLPLIIEYAAGVEPMTLPPGIAVGSALPSINGVSATLPRDQVAAFATALRTSAFPAGIAHISIDRPTRAAATPEPSPDSGLDQNLRQIGAPTAWAAGWSGKGVTVAVVASGIDTAHPDLHGKVLAAKNFSDSPAGGDVLGVGTHVASVIAGSGVASRGARKGVAYDAKLLSAKVVNDEGFGTISAAIAGMEWAVAQDADVVDLAVTAEPTDGRDPLRGAVDRLSADSGAVFVAPAGDIFFVEPYTIASPGDAAAAVTVGAVDGHDVVQGFSGQGPTRNGQRVKPNLTAPGVDIVGAVPGAAGGYGTLRGTTPAAAHVAGAAALLLQQHPGWSPGQVASGLEAAAEPSAGASVLQQGAGRLDIGVAINGAVSAESSAVDFEVVAYPQTRDVKRVVALHNDGASSVTIDVAITLTTLDGAPAVDGFATISPAAVTIPSGGSAPVTVTLRPVDGVTPGAYSGLVTGTRHGVSASAPTLLRLPVGAYWEPERYDLTVRVLDMQGQPVHGGAIEVFGKESFTDAFFPHEPLGADGEATVRIAPGYVSATSHLTLPDGSFSILAAPEVRVTKDTTVILDARKAKPIDAAVNGIDTTLTQADIHYSVGDEEGRANYYSFFPPLGDFGKDLVRATPTSLGKHGSFTLATRWRLEAKDTVYDLEYESAAIPDPPAYGLDPNDPMAVETIDSTYRGLGESAVLPSFRAYYSDAIGIALATFHPLAVPTHRVEVINARPDLHWYACTYVDAAALSRVCDADRPAMGGLARSTTWLDAVHAAAYQVQRWDDQTLFVAMGFSDGEHVGPADFSVWASTDLALYRDGELIGSQEGDFAYFTVPPGLGTYTLEHRATFSGASPLPAATSAFSRWRFTTDTPPPSGQFGIPALLGVGILPAAGKLGLADPGEPLRVRLRAEREGTPPSDADIVAQRAWASADGGKTWERVKVRAGDTVDEYVTRVPADLVRSDGAVSVRVRFAAADGELVRSRTDNLIPVRH